MRLLVLTWSLLLVSRYGHNRHSFQLLPALPSQTMAVCPLGRNVSYKHLIKLEYYKLLKDILGIEEYKPFKMYW